MKHYLFLLLVSRHARLLYSLVFCLVFVSCNKSDNNAAVLNDLDTDGFFRSCIFFDAGSYWIYKSNDGLFDTVSQTDIDVQVKNNVDDKDNLISVQYFFYMTYYSSYLHTKFIIYRDPVAPNVRNENIHIKWDGYGTNYLFATPSPFGVEKKGAIGNHDRMTIMNGDSVNWEGKLTKARTVYYPKWLPLNSTPAELVFAENIGVIQYTEIDSMRTWHLVDKYLIKHDL